MKRLQIDLNITYWFDNVQACTSMYVHLRQNSKIAFKNEMILI